MTKSCQYVYHYQTIIVTQYTVTDYYPKFVDAKLLENVGHFSENLTGVLAKVRVLQMYISKTFTVIFTILLGLDFELSI